MSKNYFAIERDNDVAETNGIYDKESETMVFDEVLDMSLEDLKIFDEIDTFVVVAMDAANAYFGDKDGDTLITLVGEDDVFIWSILMSKGDNEDDIRYNFIDWKKDGKNYRYQK